MLNLLSQELEQFCVDSKETSGKNMHVYFPFTVSSFLSRLCIQQCLENIENTISIHKSYKVCLKKKLH